jgi:hypothetical protein
MARTLIIPDIHHKTWIVDEILMNERFDAAVFLGDYFDDFNDTIEDARQTAEWLRAHIGTPEFTFLYGNHDLPYRFPMPGLNCAGFSIDKWQAIVPVLNEELWEGFQLHAWIDGWLLSHAGWNTRFADANGQVHPGWIDEHCKDCLQELSEGRMHPLAAAGRSRGGRQAVGGVTWQDWRELQPIPGLRQVVGHTPGLEVRYKEAQDGAAICLDTHLRHIGFLENGEFTVRVTSIGARHH